MKKNVIYLSFLLCITLTGCATQKTAGSEAQSAIESVRQTMTGENVNIKYCPVDGKRYSGHLETCPEHNTFLKPLEP